METVAAGARVGPATGSAKEPRIGTIEPSADGGVLVLAHAWSLLTGGDGMVAGVHWPNGLGPLLLFAMVGLPVLAVASVRAVALRCGSHDPLWRALGWGRWVTQRRLARFVARINRGVTQETLKRPSVNSRKSKQAMRRCTANW